MSDSAGIRVIDYSGELPTSAVTVPELIYEFGFNPGDYEFQAAFYGRVQSDGSAFVGDPANQEVIKVSADGDSFEYWARGGQGPGELRGLRSMHVAGYDTLWVEDYANGKLLLLGERDLIRTASTKEDRSVSFGLMAHAIDLDGRFLMSTSSFMSDFDEPWFRSQLVRFDAETGTADTVGEFDLARRRESGKASPYLPSGMLTVSNRQFVHGRTDAPSLTWRRSDGSVRQVLRWHPAPRYPTEKDWLVFESVLRSEMRRVNPSIGDSELARLIEEQLASFEVRDNEQLPVFGPLHGGETGDLWIGPFEPGFDSRPSSYFVVSSDGVRISLAQFPRPIRIVDVRGDLVLAMVTNELDVQGIAVYRVGTPNDN